MKHIIPLILVLLVTSSSQKVFICTGPQSECYHKSSDCRGLKKCSKSIKSVSLAEAKKMHRRPCGYCYGKQK